MPISFKLGMMAEITELYILISVWMTLTFIQEIKICGVHLLRNLRIDLEDFSLVSQPVCLLTLMLIYFLHKYNAAETTLLT